MKLKTRPVRSGTDDSRAGGAEPADALVLTERSNRRRGRGLGLGTAAAAVVVVLAAGAYGVYHRSAPLGGASGGLAKCGTAPTAKADQKVRITVRVPAAAASGARIKVNHDFHSLTGKPEELVGGDVDVVIVRGGKVVGKYRGGESAIGFHVTAPPAGVATLPATSVVLRGCPTGPEDDAHPDASRPLLPAGQYGLVDLFQTNGATYVSEPAVITVN